MGVYPITPGELRQLAGELMAVAMQIDNATSDTARHAAAVELVA